MEQRITVLLFGLAGCGKSTIANMLFQGDLSDDNFFEVNNSATGATSCILCNTNKTYRIFDTMGLGEGKSGTVEHSEAIRSIRNHFSELNLPLNYICYVKKKGRFIDDDRKKFKEFKEVFDDGERTFVIIITHCKQKWVDDNLKTIRENFGEYPVIGVDFPFEDEDEYEDEYVKQRHKEQRVRSLNYLSERFSTLNYEGIKLEIHSSFEAAENNAKRYISLLPVVGAPYVILTSGVYYIKGKPKTAMERLRHGTLATLSDNVGLYPVRLVYEGFQIIRNKD